MKTFSDIMGAIAVLGLIAFMIYLAIYDISIFVIMLFFLIFFLVMSATGPVVGIPIGILLFAIRAMLDAPTLEIAIAGIFWSVMIFIIIFFGFPRLFKH